MSFIETEIKGLKIVAPPIFNDDRGYFYEAYSKKIFAEAGIDTEFVQDNQARSTYGVLRGLHYQIEPYTQAKLVRVIEGTVLDVVVDLRLKSPTYGKSYAVELSVENKRQLFVPRGFAHGYIVLSPTAEFFYKCDNYYSKAHEGGVYYNDPQLAIDWKLDSSEIILSEKDSLLPKLGDHIGTFQF